MEDREEGDDEGVAEGLLLSSEYIRARLVGADDPLRVVDELQSKHGPGIKVGGVEFAAEVKVTNIGFVDEEMPARAWDAKGVWV